MAKKATKAAKKPAATKRSMKVTKVARRSKLTDSQAETIVRMKKRGISRAAIAKKYGISEVYVGQIGRTRRVGQ